MSVVVILFCLVNVNNRFYLLKHHPYKYTFIYKIFDLLYFTIDSMMSVFVSNGTPGIISIIINLQLIATDISQETEEVNISYYSYSFFLDLVFEV